MQAFVPMDAPTEMHVAAGMIGGEGGARVNTRTAPARRHVAPGSRAAAVRRPADPALGDAEAMVNLGLARFGAGVAGAASTLGSLTPAPTLPPAAATPRQVPADPGFDHKAALVLGSLFAAAAGYSLSKRVLKKTRG
jgi:hypothetical protein